MGLYSRLIAGFKAAIKTPPSQSQASVSIVFQHARGSMFSGDVKFKDAVEKGYRGLIWVYRCAKAVGESVGSVPWKVYQKGKKPEEYTPLPDHPLEKMLNAPNPYMDGREFFESWAIYMQLAGECYWEVVKVQNKPYHLYPIRPDWMEPKPDPVLFVKNFIMDPGGQAKKVTFDPEDIVWFKYLDPLDPYKGLSPIQAAARTIDTEVSSIAWNKATFDNSAVPGGVLTIPAVVLERETRVDIQHALEDQFTQENMKRPLVLWGGMDWKQMALSQQDMEWLNQRRLNKFEICGVMGVPPAIVGANEDPTYSNYEVARSAMWEDKIIPMLEGLQSKINAVLSPQFADNIIAKYDISDLPAMRKSFQEKVTTGSQLYGMGVPFNDINRRLKMGFRELPWGDVWWAPATLSPVSSAEVEPPQLPPASDVNPLTGEPLPKPKPKPGNEPPPEPQPNPKPKPSQAPPPQEGD